MKSHYLSTIFKKINKKQESVSLLRLSVGFLILGCWFYPVVFSGGLAVLYPLSLLLIIFFVFLIYQTSRLKEFKDYLLQRERLETLRSRQATNDYKYTPAELTDWNLLIAKINYNKSPHWEDLDLIKPHGLLQAIHSTGNPESLQHLVNLMERRPISSEIIQTRQNKVKVVSAGPRRKALTLLKLYPEGSSVSSTQLILKEALVENNLWLFFSYGYYLCLWISYIYYFISGKTVFGIFLMGLFGLFPLISGQIKIFKTYAWTNGFEAQLLRLQKIKKIIRYYSNQRVDQKNLILSSLSEPTINSEVGVSFEKSLIELNRIIAAIGLRQNVIVYAIVHALLPWDFFWTARADVLRKKMESVYLRWLEDLVEFEAMAMLAEYSENISNGIWPSLTSELVLTGKDLYHPLIPMTSSVANDVDLNTKNRKCLLITGSNMSGKSTFLRTLGINLMLMRIGSKVQARQFLSSPFQVLTSLKRVDSLEESLSTFYSEVKNLKDIRNQCLSHLSLYLIDEIFRGTNNRERLIGAQKYIKALLQSESLGLVTTHDLELSQMDQEYTNLVNEHFADTIQNDKMVFDYKKKLGPCPSTNALKVMEMEGVF